MEDDDYVASMIGVLISLMESRSGDAFCAVRKDGGWIRTMVDKNDGKNRNDVKIETMVDGNDGK